VAQAEDLFLGLLTGRHNYGEYYREAKRIASQQATAMSEITPAKPKGSRQLVQI
jgi:hypothetical protein